MRVFAPAVFISLSWQMMDPEAGDQKVHIRRVVSSNWTFILPPLTSTLQRQSDQHTQLPPLLSLTSPHENGSSDACKSDKNLNLPPGWTMERVATRAAQHGVALARCLQSRLAVKMHKGYRSASVPIGATEAIRRPTQGLRAQAPHKKKKKT